ncbi:hypothetical protein MADRUGA_63 [Mycobacterium phage Madruga]|uniref:Uncharacterized protein n=1 Tax=Mycobacterium phage Madruga TaxID=1675552 RepID=A0A0K1LT67_9CAUD|nr:hypothetical protein MADRUGA_63 [Mycobacterium phage Madruga]
MTVNIEQLRNDGYCAVAYTKDGEFYDACGNVETVRTMANEGYRIVAIANDGVVNVEEIQAIADYELAAAIDCFGEDHRK